MSNTIRTPTNFYFDHTQLTKNKKLDWEEKLTTALNEMEDAIKTMIENKHFNKIYENRLKCDASNEGLGACLEQKRSEALHPIA